MSQFIDYFNLLVKKKFKMFSHITRRSHFLNIYFTS